MVMFFFSKSKLLNCTFYVDEILRSFIPFVRSHRAQQNHVEQR